MTYAVTIVRTEEVCHLPCDRSVYTVTEYGWRMTERPLLCYAHA